MSADRVKVVYISGTGRSGSTVLGRILGHAEGLVPMGEGYGVWTRGVVQNEPCSCGAPFRECPFWQEVFREAYGGFDVLHQEGIVEYGHPLVRKYDMAKLLYPRNSIDSSPRLAAVAASLEKLYRAMVSVTGSRGVVDSSKPPGYALMLNAVPGIDLYVIHLVRDSRAVAYSWQKQKFKYEIDGEKIYMRAHHPLEVVRRWMGSNALLEALKYRGLKSLLVRYEDFADHPRETLDRLGSFVGIDFGTLPFVGDRSIQPRAQHVASGNPNRFEQGLIEIRRDDDWQTRLPSADRRLVGALTWPLLLRYGYGGLFSRPPERPMLGEATRG